MGLKLGLGILGKKAKRSETGEAGKGGWWTDAVIPGGTRDVPGAWEPYAWADRCWLGKPC